MWMAKVSTQKLMNVLESKASFLDSWWPTSAKLIDICSRAQELYFRVFSSILTIILLFTKAMVVKLKILILVKVQSETDNRAIVGTCRLRDKKYWSHWKACSWQGFRDTSSSKIGGKFWKRFSYFLCKKKHFQLIRMVCLCGELSWGFGVVRKTFH